MIELTKEQSVADVARLLPPSIEVFENAGIDYCCRGAHTLQSAAWDAGFDIDDLIARIASMPAQRSADESLTALVRFIIRDHQTSIGREIPRMRTTIEKAVTKHGSTSPKLARIERIFVRFAAATTAHMLNEERDLLPLIESIDSAAQGNAPLPHLRISQRVLGELVEHERLHEQMRTMRELAAQAPADCCTVALRSALDEFARHVHFHMHVENNILYPRAIEMENQLRRTQTA